jgi:hypothetical protein
LTHSWTCESGPFGLKQQDNDLILIRDLAVVAAFEARFTTIYQSAEPMRTEPQSPRTGPDPKPKQSPGCLIKGTGRHIYHLPGGLNYDDINMGKLGTRWFCSEDEAKASGWRPAAH